MSNMKYAFAAAAVAIAVTGCSSTPTSKNATMLISNDQYVVDLPKAGLAPQDLFSKKQKLNVAVIHDPAESQMAKITEAPEKFSTYLESIVAQSGALVIDRELAEKMKDEILVHELNGSFMSGDLKTADYVMRTKVTKVNVGSKLSENVLFTVNGKVQKWCSYSGSVSAELKIYKLPELSLVDTLPLTANSSATDKDISRGCEVYTNVAHNLIDSAAEKAIKQAGDKIKNAFTLGGYVAEYRTDGKENMVLVSIGSKEGVKAGDTINFIRQTKSKASGTVQETILGSGQTYQDLVYESEAWVSVDDNVASNLMIGDIAKHHFN